MESDDFKRFKEAVTPKDCNEEGELPDLESLKRVFDFIDKDIEKYPASEEHKRDDFAVSNEVRADFDILFRYVDGLKHRIDCLERTHDFEQREIDRLENEVEEYAQTLRDVESWSLWKHFRMFKGFINDFNFKVT